MRGFRRGQPLATKLKELLLMVMNILVGLVLIFILYITLKNSSGKHGNSAKYDRWKDSFITIKRKRESGYSMPYVEKTGTIESIAEDLLMYVKGVYSVAISGTTVIVKPYSEIDKVSITTYLGKHSPIATPLEFKVLGKGDSLQTIYTMEYIYDKYKPIYKSRLK